MASALEPFDMACAGCSTTAEKLLLEECSPTSATSASGASFSGASAALCLPEKMRLKQGHVLHVNNVNVNENSFQPFQHYNNYNALTNNFTGVNNTSDINTGNTGVYITGDTQNTTFSEDTLQWCNTIDAIQNNQERTENVRYQQNFPQQVPQNFPQTDQLKQFRQPFNINTTVAARVAQQRRTVPQQEQHRTSQNRRNLPSSLCSESSPDDSLVDFEEVHQSCSSVESTPQDEDRGFDISDSESLSDDGNLSGENTRTRGIVNPNYPGFQHLAHTLEYSIKTCSDTDFTDDDLDLDPNPIINSNPKTEQANNINNNNNNNEDLLEYKIDSVNRLDSVENIQKVFYDKPKLNIPLEPLERDPEKRNNCLDEEAASSNTTSDEDFDGNIPDTSDLESNQDEPLEESQNIIGDFGLEIQAELSLIERGVEKDLEEAVQKLNFASDLSPSALKYNIEPNTTEPFEKSPIEPGTQSADPLETKEEPSELPKRFPKENVLETTQEPLEPQESALEFPIERFPQENYIFETIQEKESLSLKRAEFPLEPVQKEVFEPTILKQDHKDLPKPVTYYEEVNKILEVDLKIQTLPKPEVLEPISLVLEVPQYAETVTILSEDEKTPDQEENMKPIESEIISSQLRNTKDISGEDNWNETSNKKDEKVYENEEIEVQLNGNEEKVSGNADNENLPIQEATVDLLEKGEDNSANVESNGEPKEISSQILETANRETVPSAQINVVSLQLENYARNPEFENLAKTPQMENALRPPQMENSARPPQMENITRPAPVECSSRAAPSKPVRPGPLPLKPNGFEQDLTPSPTTEAFKLKVTDALLSSAQDVITNLEKDFLSSNPELMECENIEVPDNDTIKIPREKCIQKFSKESKTKNEQEKDEDSTVPRKKEKIDLDQVKRRKSCGQNIGMGNVVVQKRDLGGRNRENLNNRRSVPAAREKKRPSPEVLGSFDVYNIETAMPKIDLDAIESHLKAAREEERRRRTDREEIRRRLAMGSEDDYYTGNDRPGRKPSLQARLQSGMNLQICFMNETASDTDSPNSDSEHPITKPNTPPSSKQNVNKQNGGQPNMNNKNTQQRPASLNLSPAPPPLLQPVNQPMTEADFFARQARLQTEARMALAQAKEMAHMQMEIERQRQKESPITEMIRSSFEKVGIPFPKERRRVSRQILTEMNVAQLQVIVNDLHTQIETLNEQLVRFLMNRDDLHMEQDSMLVDIEDLTRYLGAKEQTVKEQKITQVNNNIPPPSPAPQTPPLVLNNSNFKPRLHRLTSLVKK